MELKGGHPKCGITNKTIKGVNPHIELLTDVYGII